MQFLLTLTTTLTLGFSMKNDMIVHENMCNIIISIIDLIWGGVCSNVTTIHVSPAD